MLLLKGADVMEIKVIYPLKRRRHRFWKFCCMLYNWAFLISLFVCPFINIVTGGKAWSVVVIISEFLIWSSFISPSMFELNRTSQSIKLFLNILLLLVSIDLFIEGGWGLFVIPIVSFGGLIACSALFFSDFNQQRHNAIPFILFATLALLAGLVGCFAPFVETRWVFIVLGSLSFGVLLVTLILLRRTVILDIKKQLNTK